jgi:SAM-dependent methyltransferase
MLEIGSAIACQAGHFDGVAEYKGMDVAPSAGVDIVSIAHEYDKEDESYDVVCSFSQLEHDMYWEKTLKKMVELTRPGGLIFFSCCYNWEEHGTLKTSPEQSLNTQMGKEWGNYYRNLRPKDIKKVWNLDKIFKKHCLEIDPRTEIDLHFWGIKR